MTTTTRSRHQLTATIDHVTHVIEKLSEEGRGVKEEMSSGETQNIAIYINDAYMTYVLRRASDPVHVTCF